MANTELQAKAELMSVELQEALANLAKEFDLKIKEKGAEYGLQLITEINVGIEADFEG